MYHVNEESSGFAVERRGPPASPIAELVQLALGFLRRQWLVLLTCLLVGSGLGLAYVLITPPTYSASALVLMDARTGKFSPERSILGEAPVNAPAWSDSQLIILRSENILESVVRSLNLTSDPEFAIGRPSLGQRLASFFRGSVETDSAAVPLDPLQVAIEAVDARLEVSRSGYLIEIKFHSHDAERAAEIANAIANAYLEEQIAAKSRASQRASHWLQGRLAELREQASSAENAVAEFKLKNSIISTEGKLISDQKLIDLNTRLVEARSRTNEAEARLNQIQAVTKGDPQSTISAVPDSLTNPIITKLRTEYLDLFHREAEWAEKYGDQHRMVVRARERLREIRLSIHDELRRITESYRSEYMIAKARDEALQRQVDDLVKETQKAGVAQIQLRTLENAAQSYRALYNNFFQKFTEAQQSSPDTEARIISLASKRSFVSHPRITLVAAFALFGGLAMGVGFGGLRELMDRAVRTRDQTSTAVGIDTVAIVPLLKPASHVRQPQQLPAPRRSDARLFDSRSEIVRAIVNDPLSPFSDAVRSMKMMIDFHPGPTAPKIIGIVSTLAGEGKSTLSLALAELMAQTGSRVTLLDCDFRKPSLSRVLTPNADVGLADVLYGNAPLKEALWADSRTGLQFLPNNAGRKIPHANEILSSAAMKDVVDRLAVDNDYVVVDLSPLVAGVDARATVNFIDGYMFVVRWGQTTMDAVYQALDGAPSVHAKLLGVALNKVNLKKLSRYDALSAPYYAASDS